MYMGLQKWSVKTFKSRADGIDYDFKRINVKVYHCSKELFASRSSCRIAKRYIFAWNSRPLPATYMTSLPLIIGDVSLVVLFKVDFRSRLLDLLPLVRSLVNF